jgi:hypothetical protein
MSVTPLAIPVVPTITRPDGAVDNVNRLTAGQIPQGVYDISDTIYTKNAKAAPFTWFLDAIGHGSGHDTTHRWYEQETVPQRDTISGSINGGATTLTVATASKWTVNDTLWEPNSNAQGIVTAVNFTTGVLTITWITAAALADGTTVMRIGNQYPDYSQIQLGPVSREVEITNYFQDMRHGRAIADVTKHDPVRVTQPYWDQVMSAAMNQHSIEKEKTLLFGQASLDTTGVKPRGAMRGLYNFLATNRTAVGAALTRPVWETFCTDIVSRNTHPNQNWVAFVSGRIRQQISGFSATFERTDTMAKQFGMAIEDWKCPDGTIIHLVTHPLFHFEGLDGLGFLVNMSPEVCKYIARTVFDTKRYKSLLPYGLSGYEEYYRTCFTLEFKGEDINGGRLTGVTN